MAQALTLYEKLWNAHLVDEQPDGMCLLYIDRHLVHEVTSPQAFEGLRAAGRRVRRPGLTLAVPDHNLPTTARRDPLGNPIPVSDQASAEQLATLRANAEQFCIPYFEATDARQGIVHVVGPEQGFTLPGTTLVCGDSHSAAHGALGALAFGIGTSEVEHVLATQTLLLRRSRTLEVCVEGRLGPGVTAKDVIMHIIGVLGASGGNGHVIEYTGNVIREMTIEGRLTICNMSIEAGARAGLIAPDDKTFAYLKGRPMAPQGKAWDEAEIWWRSLSSDPDARYDRSLSVDADTIVPSVTWGTSPEHVLPITGHAPELGSFADPGERQAAQKALDYMGLAPGTPLAGLPVEHIFIGSCTNGRIEDLREAALILRGRHIAKGIRQALVVPGSGLVKAQAEREGLDRIFIEAGFEWREPGCSMCLGMNPDKVPAGERCASTSNRNFAGRQGPGARTHLLSPAMAAAAAVAGCLTDVRTLIRRSDV